MSLRVHTETHDVRPSSPPESAWIVEVVPHQLIVSLAVGRADDLEAGALISVMQRERFDLRRRMFLAFAVDFGGKRDSAYAAVGSKQAAGWDTALYGDTSGWVARLSRTRRLSREAVRSDITEVKLLAQRFRGEVRSVTVEDLRNEDRWAAMASRVQGSQRPRGDAIPAPRRPMGPMSGGA